MLVCSLDNFVVADRTAGLDDGFYTGFGCGVDGVSKREEGFRSQGGTGDVEVHCLGFFEGALAGIDARCHSHAHRDHGGVFDIDDAVRLRECGDLPCDFGVF